jgi:hypothetical protein
MPLLPDDATVDRREAGNGYRAPTRQPGSAPAAGISIAARGACRAPGNAQLAGDRFRHPTAEEPAIGVATSGSRRRLISDESSVAKGERPPRGELAIAPAQSQLCPRSESDDSFALCRQLMRASAMATFRKSALRTIIGAAERIRPDATSARTRPLSGVAFNAFPCQSKRIPTRRAVAEIRDYDVERLGDLFRSWRGTRRVAPSVRPSQPSQRAGRRRCGRLASRATIVADVAVCPIRPC